MLGTSSAAFVLDYTSSEPVPPPKPPKPTTTWTSDLNERLIEMWNEGASAAEIGAELGMTRNAVLGKRFRLKLEERHPVTPRSERKMRETQMKIGKPAKPVPRYTRPPVIEDIPEPPVDGAVSLIDLEERHCRYPAGYGTDKLMMYCGATRVKAYLPDGNSLYDGPYCAYHNRLCYRPNVR